MRVPGPKRWLRGSRGGAHHFDRYPGCLHSTVVRGLIELLLAEAWPVEVTPGRFFRPLLAFLPLGGLLLGGSAGACRRAAGSFAPGPAAEADPERSPMHAEPHDPTPMAAPL